MLLSWAKQDSRRKDSNITTVALYNLPKSWSSLSAVLKDLNALNPISDEIVFKSSVNMMFRNSCHLCLRDYKDLFEYKNGVLITCQTNDNVAQLTESLKSLSVKVKSICQAKDNKNLFCPLIMAQKDTERMHENTLIQSVEEWFSDEEIFTHKDILVAMNNGGWVPISVLSKKLEDKIIISDNALTDRLSNSLCLVIDSTRKFLRRSEPTLPLATEWCQIILMNIPDRIKSIKQLPALLKIDRSNIESFDYKTHSALVTLDSREEAENYVADGMRCRLLVPNIVTEKNEEPIEDNVEPQLQRMISNLTIRDSFDSNGKIHVARLSPDDLTYTWPLNFVVPSQEMMASIVKQCNFYFSDTNVLKDLFILKKIKSNNDGWIEMETIAKFKLMVKLSGDSVANVVYAMCHSDQVQISRDGLSLRRRLPLPEWDSSFYISSLFLWNLPAACHSFESLDHVFKEEGRFVVKVSRYISASRNVPADLRKLADNVRALGKQDVGVVEFLTRDAMMCADEFIHRKWSSVNTFYLDINAELPKPASMVGKGPKCLPAPLPIIDSCCSNTDNIVPWLQAGTNVDPKLREAKEAFVAKKREERKPELPKMTSDKDFPSLTSAGSRFKDKTNDKLIIGGAKTHNGGGSKKSQKTSSYANKVKNVTASTDNGGEKIEATKEDTKSIIGGAKPHNGGGSKKWQKTSSYANKVKKVTADNDNGGEKIEATQEDPKLLQ